jgi:hypothetical protein
VIRFCLLALIIALNPVVVSNGKIRGSTNAQERYLFPFFVLPFPFCFPLLVRVLPTQRQ